MMNVVIPLSGVLSRLAALRALQITRLIAIVFQYQVNVAAGRNCRTDGIRQFGEDIGSGIVNDRVNGIQPKPVKMIFDQPIERVMDEEISNCAAMRAVEVDGVAPRGGVPVGEELWRVKVKVVSLRTEMVVDNIEEYHQPSLMGTLHQFLQILGAAVDAIGREWKNSVV